MDLKNKGMRIIKLHLVINLYFRIRQWHACGERGRKVSHILFSHFLRKDRLANPPTYFPNNSLEEVQSLKLLGLTISYDFSWANQISNLASKASSRLGILHHSVLPSHTWTLIHLQGLLPQLHGVLFALLSGLAPLPHTFLSLMPWKTRPSWSLKSHARKLSLTVLLLRGRVSVASTTARGSSRVGSTEHTGI